MFFTKSSHPSMNPLLLSLTEADSPFVEAYRRLYRKIHFFYEQNQIQTIALTSTQPGEGKTLTSINLALAISEDASKKVALVDCDFRRPTVPKYLGGQVDKGLVDIMEGQGRLQDIAMAMNRERSNLHVIPAGRYQGDPYALFYNKQLDPIMKELKNSYDLIIIDSPPILPILDQTFLADLVDAVLLVIRAGKAAKGSIKIAMESLEGKNLIGLIFNDVEKQASSSYKYQYVGYYDYAHTK